MITIERLQRTLSGIYITTDPAEILYLTGVTLSRGMVVIHPEKGGMFVDGRYTQAVKEQQSLDVYALDAYPQFLQSLPLLPVFLDGQRLSFTEYTTIEQRLQGIGIPKVENHNPLKRQRMVKDTQELAKMERTARLNWECLYATYNSLQVGVTEKEVAWFFERQLREKGGYLAFDPIIAFGANSAHPHYHPSDTQLKERDTVLIDVGATLDDYTSDCTRTYAFGPPDPFFLEVKGAVLAAKQAAFALCRAGTRIQDLDQAVKETFQKRHWEEHYVHALGHGLGVEVHEFPSLTTKLQEEVLLEPGMVITIEPGLYFPGRLGVRAEDTIAITEEGYENWYPEDRVGARQPSI